MRFGIGDKVRVKLPEGANWNRKTATTTVSTDEINGAEGVITQVLSFSGQPECKVLTAFGEFRFWERDLEAASVEPVEAPINRVIAKLNAKGIKFRDTEVEDVAVEPEVEEESDGG